MDFCDYRERFVIRLGDPSQARAQTSDTGRVFPLSRLRNVSFWLRTLHESVDDDEERVPFRVAARIIGAYSSFAEQKNFVPFAAYVFASCFLMMLTSTVEEHMINTWDLILLGGSLVLCLFRPLWLPVAFCIEVILISSHILR